VYWCSDCGTYVWQKEGINVPTFPGMGDFARWAHANNRWSTDLSQIHLGNAIFYWTNGLGRVRRGGG